MTDELSECWVENRIIALVEGKPCKLPEESEYNSLCTLLSEASLMVSNLSIRLSQSLSLLPRDESIQSRLSCDEKERIIYFQSQGVASPTGVFTFKPDDSSEFTIVIYPKIFEDDPSGGLGALVYMIERVIASHTDIQSVYLTQFLAGAGNLLEVWMKIIYLLYIRLLRRELLRGAYHEYISAVQDNPKVSGKILVSRQARKPTLGRLSIIQESYPYTIDNTLNRVLKYAATIAYNDLLQLGRIAGEAREVLSLLSDVELDPSSVWRRVEFNRLNMRFENLYYIALLIILARGLPGEKTLNGLLIDMNKLFELYIYSLLKEGLENWQAEHQVRLEFVRIHGGINGWRPVSKEQYPDILLRSRLNNQFIVLDTKYSQINSAEDIPTENLRQIFTYHILLENLNAVDCVKRNVYSAILYLAKDTADENYIKSIYGTYKVATRQKCFKIILLSPQAILKAAENIPLHTDIEKKIVEKIVDLTGCQEP